jgi:hypothetical protein
VPFIISVHALLLQMLFLLPGEVYEISESKCLHNDGSLWQEFLLVSKGSFQAAFPELG